MRIRKAAKKDLRESFNIAKELSEWFNKEGIKNVWTDFLHNNTIVCLDGKKISGFLCYSTNCGKMQLIWMGVKKKYMGEGIGKRLLGWIIKEAKKYHLYAIEVETLPDEDNYEPYKLTRDFYVKTLDRKPHLLRCGCVLSIQKPHDKPRLLSRGKTKGLFDYKNGFKRIEYKKARIKGWDDQILMELRLK